MPFKKRQNLYHSISRFIIYIVNLFDKRKIPNQVTLQPELINPALTWVLFSVLHFQGVMWFFNNQSHCFLFILFNKAVITERASQATHSNSDAAPRNISVKSALMRYQNITSASLGSWTVLWKAKPCSLAQISKHQVLWSNISQNIFPQMSDCILKGVADNINVP